MTFELEISEFELRRVLLVQEADVDFFLYRKGAGESIVLDSSGVLFLLERGLHNFSDQEPGYGNAIVKSGFLIDAKGAEMHSSVEIFQKTIGDRPKILKVQGLEETFEDGDLVLACWSPKRMAFGFLNVTHSTELHIQRIVQSFVGAEQDGNSKDEPALKQLGATGAHEPPHNSDSSSAAVMRGLIGAIWSRSYGGSLSAESPTSTSLPSEFLGEWSPGLVEMAGLFESEIKAENSTRVSFFLVGGPGSGKSTFAKGFLQSLGHDFPSTGISNLRSMEIPLGRGILFVNDASIKRHGGADSILSDMLVATREQKHLFVCANRGVFADELNSSAVSGSTFNESVLLWLSQKPNQIRLDGFDLLVTSDYLRVARVLEEDGGVRILVAVYMDVCSLLENRPEVKVSQLGWDGITSKNQKLGSICHGEDATYRLESPIGELVTRLAKAIHFDAFAAEYSVGARNPIVGNLKSLADRQHVSGLLQILRIAEINSGTRLNYRAFWSLLTRYVFGRLVDRVALTDLPGALLELDALVDGSTNFDSALQLYDYRSPGSLFEAFASNPQDPALRFLNSADPILGSTPETPSGQGVRRTDRSPTEVLLDCFQSIDRDESILATARDQGLSDFVESLSPFDFFLDTSYTELLAEGYVLEERSRSFTTRYARHLSRMLSTFFGTGAGAEEASMWLSLWEASPAIPSEGGVLPRFNSLFKPKMTPGDGDSPSLIPLLDSKLAPLGVQSRVNPKLATSLDNVHLETIKEGPDLFLILKELGFELGRIRVDFSLLREVISSSGMTHGVTDQSSFVDPRLDRVRGTKLAATAQSRGLNFTLVLGGDLRDVFVGDLND